MSLLQDERRTEAYDQLFGVLADETRRTIVRILRERTDTISEAELAERLAATAPDSQSGDSAPDAAKSLRIRLYHAHLPKLADSGLIDWDSETGAVSATDHVVYEAFRSEKLTSPEKRDELVSALAASRRRDALAIVESENGRVEREELARKLASEEADGQPAEALIERINIELHHHHLPKLEEADLVEYDLDDAFVAYRGPPELTAILAGSASDSESMVTIEGELDTGKLCR